jgi:O-antigen biosynthesis protein
MKLSVIIVSYNVKNFLENCLVSVHEAISGIEAEVIVVDNNSADGSARMVADKFPTVKLISNSNNLGFSIANNQARPFAGGEFILFLNPDTLVEKETFRICIDFMNEHPDAGAMGVKMVDGKGRYLPESKRSLPTPVVAFYKTVGLTALFPRSKRFGQYYLSHLDNSEIHKIEVLTGAFFFARKKALDTTGWFDEEFFMYGEDIDLSCRLLRNNYSIWYHPGTSITHFKGESTKKSTINYVLVFYRAMIIYARKHFSSPETFLLLAMLQIAIYSRAGLSIVRRIFSRMALPALDAAAILAGFPLVLGAYENYFPGRMILAQANQAVLAPVLIIIWIISIYLSGGYKKPLHIAGNIRGLLYGSIAILLVYGMLGAGWLLKAAVILPLALWAGLVTSLIRAGLSFISNHPGKKIA